VKPKTYSVPPALFAKVKDEVERLCKTIWEPSSSPIALPMVVAAKATPPFVRIVGDYRVINKFVKVFHFPIPNVIHEIHKVMRFSLYSDVDFMNAFHQSRLSPESSAYLSVQTPFGQYQPKFLPEGVAPASGFLMAAVTEIFIDMMEWIVVIFDNLLILAMDFQEMYEKVEKVLLRCSGLSFV
jgi:hypothetical protein